MAKRQLVDDQVCEGVSEFAYGANAAMRVIPEPLGYCKKKGYKYTVLGVCGALPQLLVKMLKDLNPGTTITPRPGSEYGRTTATATAYSVYVPADVKVAAAATSPPQQRARSQTPQVQQQQQQQQRHSTPEPIKAPPRPTTLPLLLSQAYTRMLHMCCLAGCVRRILFAVAFALISCTLLVVGLRWYLCHKYDGESESGDDASGPDMVAFGLCRMFTSAVVASVNRNMDD